MKCPNCGSNEAKVDSQLGIIPCAPCASHPHPIPHKQIEFTSESIKEQRKTFSSDIRPAHRKGELDRGFVEKYGAKKAKQQGFSDREIHNAKYVWGVDDYYRPI